MPRIPGPPSPTSPRVRSTAEGADARPARTAPATASAALAPADVYASLGPALTSPAAAFAKEHAAKFPGYRWDAAVFDEVMKRFGIGDAFALAQTAVALDRGDRYLSRDELLAAARKTSAHVTEGYRWSPDVLADVMRGRGIAEETALLREAKKHDDGDKVLGRVELERAADVLTAVVQPNDVGALLARVEGMRGRDGVEVTSLGEIGGFDVPALRFPCTSGAPKLRVVVTGGVHGNEPCGAAAALLLCEQLLTSPKLRADVELLVVPLVNPRGLANGTRRTPENIDVNRVFNDDTHDPREETLLTRFLDGKAYDLALDLHSGKAARDGFWLLHRNAEDIAGEAMARFGEEYPRLHRDAKPYHLSAPGVAKSDSTKTLKDFHIANGARWSITLEAPGSVSYVDQVLGENELMHQLIASARARVYAADV